MSHIEFQELGDGLCHNRSVQSEVPLHEWALSQLASPLYAKFLFLTLYDLELR
jgi:hypothetical protein